MRTGRARSDERRRRGWLPPLPSGLWGRVGLALLGLVLLVALYAVSLYFWGDSRLRHTDAFDTYAGAPRADPGADWLLVGIDAIMVLHYGDSGPYLVSIPGDSYVSIPGHGKNKINAAYALGGAKLLTRTVEQATGLRLDHYAETDFLGLVHMVDSLGGVTVCVPAGGLRDAGADFAAGCQHMNGARAVAYVRVRDAGPAGDLRRVKRQRQVVSAVARKGASVSVLLPPWRLIPFLGAVDDALTVDDGTGVRDLARMGLALKNRAGGAGAATTVPVGPERGVPGVGEVVEWDRTKAEQLFSALRDDAAIPASDLK
ncbi:LCP family protein [Streptomyces sp. NPDC048415]|uniref:LCP family protein n=1 Tax=Streptomyces sp. NPDC048415 TaxID=3154822 RepID=UPI00343A37EB